MSRKDFKAPDKGRVRLDRWPTRVAPIYKSNEDYEHRLRKSVEELSELQSRLYASDRYAVLLIFQALDAAGKDGTIRHVLSGVNPQGCDVHTFKQPSAAELAHDFLWRSYAALPARGRIGIFNRSYYEEVLVVRVHPELLAREGVPEAPAGHTLWKQRYHAITRMEKHLYRNGTRILKFFLHISKEEQRRRFLARIDDPSKNWKFNPQDVEERKHWKEYMRAYEQCINATRAKHAPWFVIPADDKENARLMVADAIVREMRALRLEYPRLDAQHLRDLRAMRETLEN